MKKRVIDALARTLPSLGLEQREPLIYAKPVNEQVLGWLGLNLATQDSIKVNPVIGVRHQPLETMVAQLRGKEPHGYLPPTLSRPLGYLMPANTFLTWSFASTDTDAQVQAQAADLGDAISAFGLPFIAKLGSLAAIRELMEQGGYGVPSELAYRILAAEYLAGRIHEAKETLAADVARWGKGEHEAAASFRRFADAMSALIDKGPPQRTL